MILLLIGLFCSAKDLPGEELFIAPPKVEARPLPVAVASQTASVKVTEPSVQKVQTALLAMPVVQPIKPAHKQKVSFPKPVQMPFQKTDVNANIPPEYLASNSRESTASELIQPPKGSSEIYRGIRVGDILELNVSHSVIAFPDEKAPVVAVAFQGIHAGLRFIGESYLEPNTKRIFINFSRLVLGSQIFELKGVGVSSLGQPGLEGEYHSREVEYFTGDFLSSFVAGYFDGLVPRQTNAYGQTITEPSVDNAVKKGLSSGALSTATRFREKLKKVPEFSEIKGPFTLKILILDQVKTTN